MTIPNPNIVANMEDPPYDIIGSGAPTIGTKPNTMDILTQTKIKKDAAKPKQKSLAKLFLASLPIKKILYIINP